MVFVKVRETYDLHTVQNKMTVIAIHTPKSDIIKRNYPGLLMQCKAYRPVSADVRLACASVLPLDPQGVGLAEGDVAPEDVFNPILYKAISNFGMSQLEARLCQIGVDATDINGDTAAVDNDSFTNINDEFNLYYGLLANTHEWKHANPQSGLSMTKLRPLVYEMLYNVGDNFAQNSNGVGTFGLPAADGSATTRAPDAIRGNAKPMPFINCTAYDAGNKDPGFDTNGSYPMTNNETQVPYLNVIVGAIIVPPSRLHQLFFRMVVEWTIEFSGIRPLGEIMSFVGLGRLGNATHYQSYNYSSTKKVVTGDEDTILDKERCMVASNVDIEKVM